MRRLRGLVVVGVTLAALLAVSDSASAARQDIVGGHLKYRDAEGGIGTVDFTSGASDPM